MLGRLNALRLSLLSAAPSFVRQPYSAQGIRNMADAPPNSASSSGSSSSTETATFASGCFWGTEHIFLKHFPPSQNKGILHTRVGYTGGRADAVRPSYREVCTAVTGHAEACRIEFDPGRVSYAELVEFFYRTHDPTTVDRQGPDRGSQYRSAIFTHSDAQLETAKRVTDEVQQKYFDPKGQKIVTQIESAGPWYDGEEYHQEYLFNNPSGYQCPTHVLHW